MFTLSSFRGVLLVAPASYIPSSFGSVPAGGGRVFPYGEVEIVSRGEDFLYDHTCIHA